MYFLCQYDNIAKLYGYCQKPACILMKHYSLGTLGELIFCQHKRPLLQPFVYRNDLILDLAIGLVSGLLVMHEAGFSHNDIKPANILLEAAAPDRLRAVLTDFGISRIVKDTVVLVSGFQKSKIKGASIPYASPDVLRSMTGKGDLSDTTFLIDTTTTLQSVARNLRQQRLLKNDCYSLAIVLFEMTTRTHAWGSATQEQIIWHVLSGGRPTWTLQLMEQQDEITVVLRNVITSCWSEDHQERPSMAAVSSILLSLEK